MMYPVECFHCMVCNTAAAYWELASGENKLPVQIIVCLTHCLKDMGKAVCGSSGEGANTAFPIPFTWVSHIATSMLTGR